MILSDLVNQIAKERDLEPCTIAQYQRAAAKFSLRLGKIAELSDLCEEKVNDFLSYLRKQGRTSTTICNYRVSLTVIWNFARSKNLCPPYDPRQIKRPKIEDRPVRSWSLSQIKILVDACDKIPGRLRCGVTIAAFLKAWVRTGYDTGLRPSDLRLMRWCDVDLSSGHVTISQHKTKRMHTAKLSETACNLLAKIEHPARDKVFPLSKSGLRRIELILFSTASKLGFRRMRGQALGVLRKTHATQIYEQEGDYAAAESLGHVGGVRTVRKYYIDSKSIKSGRLPPDPAA